MKRCLGIVQHHHMPVTILFLLALIFPPQPIVALIIAQKLRNVVSLSNVPESRAPIRPPRRRYIDEGRGSPFWNRPDHLRLGIFLWDDLPAGVHKICFGTRYQKQIRTTSRLRRCRRVSSKRSGSAISPRSPERSTSRSSPAHPDPSDRFPPPLPMSGRCAAASSRSST